MLVAYGATFADLLERVATGPAALGSFIRLRDDAVQTRTKRRVARERPRSVSLLQQMVTLVRSVSVTARVSASRRPCRSFGDGDPLVLSELHAKIRLSRGDAYGQSGVGHGYHKGFGDGAKQGGVVGALITLGATGLIVGGQWAVGKLRERSVARQIAADPDLDDTASQPSSSD